jgi:hypothetical protein
MNTSMSVHQVKSQASVLRQALQGADQQPEGELLGSTQLNV